MIESFDIESLFTKILLQKRIDLLVEKLFQDSTHVDNLSKNFFRELLTRTLSESLVLLNQEFYKHHDGVAIGFSLGPTLAHVSVSYHEKICLQNCPTEFKPVIYRRYVDDTLLFFSLGTPNQKIPKFFKSSSKKHQIHF